MFGSVVIDVVIAMALIFTVFSLVTSGLREVVAWVFRTRSLVLWSTVRGLLEDPIADALQPIRVAVAAEPGPRRGDLTSAVDEVQSQLRAARTSVSNPAEWEAAVDAAVSGLPAGLAGVDDPQNLVGTADTKLKAAYSEQHTKWWAQVFSFFRRGQPGIRPTVPAVPSLGNVTLLADSVRRGVRPFTDALYDHPAIRQIDRTSRGRESRMTSLEAGDFSTAAISLIQAAGVDRLIEDRWSLVVDALAAESDTVSHSIDARLQTLERAIGNGTASIAMVADTFGELRTEVGGKLTGITRELEALERSLSKVAAEPNPVDLIAAGDDIDPVPSARVDHLVGDERTAIELALHARLGMALRQVDTELNDLKGRIAQGTAGPKDAAKAFSRIRSRLDGFPGEAGDALADLEDHISTTVIESKPLDLVEAGLESLQSIGPVRDAVAGAAGAARRLESGVQEQLDELTARLSAWYDSRMDAASGWYRKRSRLVGFLLALVVVLLFNVDAVDIPRELWRNENVRTAVVAVAESSQLELTECAALEGDAATSCVQANVDKLIETGLPVGWVDPESCDGECSWPFEGAWHAAGVDNGWWAGILKLLGWVLGAAALTMGASFWFDVLRRATGIKTKLKGQTSESQT